MSHSCYIELLFGNPRDGGTLFWLLESSYLVFRVSVSKYLDLIYSREILRFLNGYSPNIIGMVNS